MRNKAIYLALGILTDGTPDILCVWIENTEGAKFWMKRAAKEWKEAMNQFAIAYRERFTRPAA